MPCPRTDHLLREYFSDDLSPVLRAEIEEHVTACADCAAQLRELTGAARELRDWEEIPAPRWDRHMALFQRERGEGRERRWRLAWQWIPAAACALMLGLTLLNTSLVYQGGALEISFGSPELTAVDRRLAEFNRLQAEEREEFADMLVRFEQLRMQDLETMQAGYELLADRDYETVRSLQQLVSLVGSTGVTEW